MNSKHVRLVKEQRAALAGAMEAERSAILAYYGPLISRANSAVREDGSPEWHLAPDGTPCCCTAEERSRGCGCF